MRLSINDLRRWKAAVQQARLFRRPDRRSNPREVLARRRRISSLRIGNRLARLSRQRATLPLAPRQRVLAELMSDLSEDIYSAGWPLQGEAAEPISQADRADLRELSEEIGGWIYWKRGVGEAFVPREQWLAMYQVWKERRS
jgi:hypothetical protein